MREGLELADLNLNAGLELAVVADSTRLSNVSFAANSCFLSSMSPVGRGQACGRQSSMSALDWLRSPTINGTTTAVGASGHFLSSLAKIHC